MLRWQPTDALDASVLLKIGLSHKILHIHMIGSLRNNDRTLLIVELDVCEVLPLIPISTHLKEVLISCFVIALIVVF